MILDKYLKGKILVVIEGAKFDGKSSMTNNSTSNNLFTQSGTK